MVHVVLKRLNIEVVFFKSRLYLQFTYIYIYLFKFCMYYKRLRVRAKKRTRSPKYKIRAQLYIIGNLRKYRLWPRLKN